jgi:integrase
LVEPANARRALEHLYERAGKQKTTQLNNQARVLVKLAQVWVKAPEGQLKALRKLDTDTRIARSGLTDKNLDRLAQFALRSNEDLLLQLPGKVLKSAEATPKDVDQARRVMYAMAVELLTMAPIRIKNLTELDLDERLTVVRRGGEEALFIRIDRDEVKNGRPIRIPLPDSTARRLNVYLKKYRPLLCDGPSRALFPGKGGAIRNPSGFGQAISKFILRETGLVMNPHLFRHLAAKLVLERRPEAIEIVRRLLGHKSVATTLKFYAELKQEIAFREYDAMIADLLAALEAPPKARSRKRAA